MTRQDDRKSAKRETILDAAIKAFREEGYESTSMDRIAEVAGASKRTVYNHFESKELLFQGVVERLLGQVASLKQIDWNPERPLEEQLTDFARAKSMMVEDPSWLSLLRVALGVFIHDPALARKAMAQSAEGEVSLVRWLEAAHEAGRLDVPDPAFAAGIFYSMASGALFWPQVFEGPMKPDVLARTTKEIVETFLCRYRPRMSSSRKMSD